MIANTSFKCKICGCEFTIYSSFGKPYCPYCHDDNILTIPIIEIFNEGKDEVRARLKDDHSMVATGKNEKDAIDNLLLILKELKRPYRLYDYRIRYNIE